jgi:signal transduction histidine kinase/DNA-binding NarL/FixJ family response regulator
MADDDRLWGVRVLGVTADRAELCTQGSFAEGADSLAGAAVAVGSSIGEVMESVSDLSQRPHVVVVDLGSRSDDFDVCELAGKLTAGFSIPVLIAMARTDLAHMNDAMAARPAGYLHKPVTAEAVRSAIADLVPERPRPQAMPPVVETNADSESVGDAASAPVLIPPIQAPSEPTLEALEKDDPEPVKLSASMPDPQIDLPLAANRPPLPVINKLRAPGPEAEVVDETEPEQEPSVQSPPAGGAMSHDTRHLHPSAGSSEGVDWQREVRGQQLQGLGLLGRGFAHEFNNLLTVLIGNLSLAQDRYESGEDVEPDSELATAQAAADRARRMVQQLLTFAEGGRPVRDSVRIADVARSVLMAHRKLHPAIRFQFQCTEPDLRVSVDRDQISRLLENLVTNAIQAMSEGGTLIVRLFTATDAEIDRIRPGAGQSGLEYLLVEVIDTGVGMDEDTLKSAFDPYFTTRGDVNATGIGLTVCESIAKAHGGFLVLQSKPGRGTIATFHLPMNSATARPDIFELRDEGGEGIPGLFSESSAKAPKVAAESAIEATSPVAAVEDGGDIDEFAEVGAGRRVLVMEDDAMIRRLVVRCLGRAGYDVVETTNGQDALDMHGMAKAEGRAFELILSDLTIEDGMGGIEMMHELRQRDPAIRAIVSSGYADSPAMASPSEYGFNAVLPKPYPPRELLRSVATTMGVKAEG